MQVSKLCDISVEEDYYVPAWVARLIPEFIDVIGAIAKDELSDKIKDLLHDRNKIRRSPLYSLFDGTVDFFIDYFYDKIIATLNASMTLKYSREKKRIHIPPIVLASIETTSNYLKQHYSSNKISQIIIPKKYEKWSGRTFNDPNYEDVYYFTKEGKVLMNFFNIPSRSVYLCRVTVKGRGGDYIKNMEFQIAY